MFRIWRYFGWSGIVGEAWAVRDGGFGVDVGVGGL